MLKEACEEEVKVDLNLRLTVEFVKSFKRMLFCKVMAKHQRQYRIE